MPAFRPTEQRQIVPSGDEHAPGDRRGKRRQRQLINRKGEPRFDDLLTARFLEQTPTVSLPMNTAKTQARAVPLKIEPTVDDPDTTHNMMADRIKDFFDGGFNRNGQSWDQLLGLLLNDSLSIDTAPLEFVPTESPIEHPETGEPTHWLSEVYFVDGSIVSKVRDEKDRMPQPPAPAFYKWGNVPNSHSRIFDRFKDSSLFERFQITRLQRSARRKAVPMTSDELAILETNQQPPELSAYGRGVVQQVRPWAEILMNQDRANVRHFSKDEYAKGILNIGEQYAGEIETFREYWKDQVEGQTDSTLPKIASETVEFVPFNESLKELQYLESQEWYSKLVWMLFGEATSTVGLAEDANRATAEAQDQSVFINTTVPRLRALEQYLNQHWLPKMREYWIADAELEARFAIEKHPIMADIERRKRRDDLEKGLKTPNEIRESEGKDPLPWGDVTDTARTAFEREHPEWVLENWGGIEDVPDPVNEGGGLFGSYDPVGGRGESETKDEDSESDVGGNVIDSETTQPATPEEYDDGTPTLRDEHADLSQTRIKQETYTDYPEAASENAQMALDAREDTGNPNDCGTRTGWARANQLADREPISEETVGRMAAFRRHEENYDPDADRDNCGWMMWKAWGGEEGIAWAERVVNSEETDGVAELGTITLRRDETGTWRLTAASDDVKDDFEDPCWEGYTMVGTDEDGDPICVPEDEVPEAEAETKPFGFDNEYADHEECVADNQDKDDPDAYCAWLADETKGTGASLETALENPDAAKDALRNEHGDLPNLTTIIDEGTEALAAVIRETVEQIEPALENRWPEDPPDEQRATTPDADKALAIDFDSILDDIEIQTALAEQVMTVVEASMEEGADHEQGRLVSELEDRFDDPDASIIAAFDVEDTFAFERMRQKAAQDMVTVEDTVKERIRTELVEAAEDNEGVQGATQRLRDRVDELSDSHARLVARTESLDASRHGTQALAESADAIAGKRWRASQDSRTRPWHEAMDGEVVRKDDSFTVPSGWEGEPDYQPDDYPRPAFVVGDDQPFNCRCTQQNVLREDMPDDVQEARESDAVLVKFTDAHRGPDDAAVTIDMDLSERQFEVREEHKDAPGESFADVWTRLREEHSRSKLTDVVSVSQTTVGKWDDRVGV